MTWTGVRAAFEELLDLPPEAQAARLGALAARDPALAEEVRALLQQDARGAGFLERAPPAPRAEPCAGQRYGRYKLVRPLGSGGMGAVWEARQTEPERRVALKLVVHARWSEAERWRFEHEAQALAALSHPSVATFYEAGSEPAGDARVSWLAMELVAGARDVLAWAEERALPRDARLLLFAELCAAVEHGHQRGVLHRDLKPSNVLVGGDGRLKLIDFGVARAVGGSSASPSLRTRTGEVVGTVQSMAPEQLAGRTAEVGVASDVYSLGVLLYQLLCGRPPYDFAGVPLARAAALVLEGEPLRPSRANPDLPQDLDWILSKALEKDPRRRYQSARELAEDLQRFRAHETVQARPPSAVYRLSRYARRHRLQAALLLAVAGGLALAGAGLWSGRARARAGEAEARREAQRSGQVLLMMEGLFDGIDPTLDGREVKVADLLDAAVLGPGAIADPAVEFTVRAVRGSVYHRLELFAEARPELERALVVYGLFEPARGDRARVIGVRALLGSALTRLGEAPRGEELMRGAVAEAAAAGFERAQLEALLPLCGYLREKGASEELVTRAGELRALAASLDLPAHAVQADEFESLALQGLGRPAEALPLLERAWNRRAELGGARDRRTLTAEFNYASALQEAGRLDEADALYPEVIAGTRAVFGPAHNQTLAVLNNHAALSFARQDFAEAARRLRAVVEAYDAAGRPPTLEHLVAINNLGQALSKSGAAADAEPELRRAAALAAELLAEDDLNRGLFAFNHGACLAGLRRWDEAEPILLDAYSRTAARLPPDHPTLVKMHRTLADAYAKNGDPDGAARWRLE